MSHAKPVTAKSITKMFVEIDDELHDMIAKPLPTESAEEAKKETDRGPQDDEVRKAPPPRKESPRYSAEPMLCSPQRR